jgi:hypothetical protein
VKRGNHRGHHAWRLPGQCRDVVVPGFGGSQGRCQAGKAQACGTTAQTVQMVFDVWVGQGGQRVEAVGKLACQRQQAIPAHQDQKLPKAMMIDPVHVACVAPWQR